MKEKNIHLVNLILKIFFYFFFTFLLLLFKKFLRSMYQKYIYLVRMVTIKNFVRENPQMIYGRPLTPMFILHFTPCNACSIGRLNHGPRFLVFTIRPSWGQFYVHLYGLALFLVSTLAAMLTGFLLHSNCCATIRNAKKS